MPPPPSGDETVSWRSLSPIATILIAAITSMIFSSLLFWGGLRQGFIAMRSSPAQANSSSSAPSKQFTPTESTGAMESAIVSTIERVEPSVVSVIISKNLPVIERYFERPDDLFNDPFLPFNFSFPQYRQRGTQKQEVGGGTAFFVTADGLLMTNKHVVDDEQADYTVLLNDGRKLKAKVVARDPGNDIALLKVDGSDFAPVTFSTENVKLGQTAIAIGNALGEFRNTVSVGVVSGLSRSITAGSVGSDVTERIESIIQTDAAINHGNSGGPLLSSHGEVIGMNTAIAESAQNIGFAIPAKDLKLALAIYKRSGTIIRPQLGIRYIPISKELKEKNKLAYDYGVLVVRGEQPTELAVIPGSPADKAGIQENDIILSVDGVKLTEDTSLSSIIRNHSPGDTVVLRVVHRGQERTVEVKLVEQK